MQLFLSYVTPRDHITTSRFRLPVGSFTGRKFCSRTSQPACPREVPAHRGLYVLLAPESDLQIWSLKALEETLCARASRDPPTRRLVSSA